MPYHKISGTTTDACRLYLIREDTNETIWIKDVNAGNFAFDGLTTSGTTQFTITGRRNSDGKSLSFGNVDSVEKNVAQIIKQKEICRHKNLDLISMGFLI